MKRLLVVFAIALLAASSLNCQSQAGTKIPLASTPAQSNSSESPDMAAFDHQIAVQQEIGADVEFGLIGTVAGLAIGGLSIFDTTSTSTTTTPGQYVISQTSGQIVYVPPSTSTSSSSSPNTWAMAGGAVAGAAIGVGVYELGHRIFHWW